MSKFVCTTKDCPNNGISYETLDEAVFMECGGCQAQVEPSE
jgi:hypothetical protein